jgi:hypothetical protein
MAWVLLYGGMLAGALAVMALLAFIFYTTDADR